GAESLGSLTNNAAVGTWKDESGSGNDLVQATGSKRPLYVANVEGLPGVSFDEQQVKATQMFLRRQGAPERTVAVAGALVGASKPVILASRSSGFNFGGVIRA